jgi:hypothetical protein
MLAGVVGVEALAGVGLLGLAGVAFMLGTAELELFAGMLAPVPAVPDAIGISDVDAGVFESLLGFVTTVAFAPPSSEPLQAQIPSSPNATVQVDAPRKYMIFLRMPWRSIPPVRSLHN